MKLVLFIVVSAVVMVVVKLLEARRDVHACARTGAVKRLRALLKKDPALIRALTAEGETPVHQAAKYDQIEALRFLIAQGGEVNARSKRGVTPLHLAAAFGELEAVKLLLEKGAEVDPKEETGMTPIMAAQAGGHPAVVEALRQAGADAEAVPPVMDMGGGHFWMPVANDDPLLLLATQKARESLPTLRQLFKQFPRDSMVKFAFRSGDGPDEHLWGVLLELTEATFKARVVTPPVAGSAKVQDVRQGAVSQIEDWQVELADGRIRGGFSTLVAFSRTKEQLGRLPEEMAKHEARFIDLGFAEGRSGAGAGGGAPSSAGS